MRRSFKRVVITLFSLVLLLALGIVVIAYYVAPLVEIQNAEQNDEIIKTGDQVYIIPKKTYEKGDIVLVNACDPELESGGVCRSYGQATRKIVALPGETVPTDNTILLDALQKRSDMSGEERQNIGIVTSTTLSDPLHNTILYGTTMPISNKDLLSARRGIMPADMIYGIVEGIPSRGWNENWKYIVERTQYLPTFILRKIGPGE